jgi:hypothetical protein
VSSIAGVPCAGRFLPRRFLPRRPYNVRNPEDPKVRHSGDIFALGNLCGPRAKA